MLGLKMLSYLRRVTEERAVGRNHEIVVGGVRVGVGDFGLENQFDAEACGALLKNLQQLDARDSAETVAAGSYFLPFEENVDVVPVAERVE